MPKNLTTIEFIKKAKNIHGNKYDYLNVNYIDSKIKIDIICPKHGVFKQKPNSHLMGRGCPKCVNKNVTIEEFIKKAKNIHGNKYDYSLAKYLNSKIKIKIICPKHGEFLQIPNSHLMNRGCPKCKVEKMIISRQLTTKIFINKANLIHNYKYDYSLVEYKNNHTKIKIICSEHSIFKQIPNTHLNGGGCPKCAGLNKTTEEFIIGAKRVHGDKYDYSVTNYIGSKKCLKIICLEHGLFEQKASDHLSGCGCPICKESKGEIKIKKYLEKQNIEFIKEKIFNNCKNKLPLRFDYYLPKYKLLIEYDGEQHFKAVEYFGGEKSFITRQKIDNIKTEFAKANDIKLIRIAYNENVEEKLNKIFELTLV